ncbi:hypothetical protein [Thermosulfuriphilus sp.]
MGAIVRLIYAVVLTIWVLHPSRGFYAYAGAIISTVSWLIFLQRRAEEQLRPFEPRLQKDLSPEDLATLKQYGVFFLWPHVSRAFSYSCSFFVYGAYLASILFVLRHFYLQAVVAILGTFPMEWVARQFHPIRYINRKAKRRPTRYRPLKESLDRVAEFMRTRWAEVVSSQ